MSKYCKDFEYIFKDIHRENTPWNKTQVPTKSMNVDIWVTGTLIQLFIRGSTTQIEFPRKLCGITPFFLIGPFCTPHSMCLHIGFYQNSFAWKCCTFNCSSVNQKRVLRILKRFYFFRKLKTLKISCDSHIKRCRSPKRRAILKIPSTIFGT